MKFLMIYRPARRSIELYDDESGRLIHEFVDAPVCARAYSHARKLGGPDAIIRHDSTGVFCTNLDCLTEIPPWDEETAGQNRGACELCRKETTRC